VPPSATQHQPLLSAHAGHVLAIDNRKIARLAKLAGAPDRKAAGVEMHVRIGDLVCSQQPLCTIHAEAPGELAYAAANADTFLVGEPS
jgi:thymidine phosphorylase